MTRLAAIVALLAGPLAWVANTQLGIALPLQHCAAWGLTATVSTLVSITVAGAGAIIGLVAARRAKGVDRFLSFSGGLISCVFVFALLLEAAATLMIDPCAR